MNPEEDKSIQSQVKFGETQFWFNRAKDLFPIHLVFHPLVTIRELVAAFENEGQFYRLLWSILSAGILIFLCLPLIRRGPIYREQFMSAMVFSMVYINVYYDYMILTYELSHFDKTGNMLMVSSAGI